MNAKKVFGIIFLVFYTIAFFAVDGMAQYFKMLNDGLIVYFGLVLFASFASIFMLHQQTKQGGIQGLSSKLKENILKKESFKIGKEIAVYFILMIALFIANNQIGDLSELSEISLKVIAITAASISWVLYNEISSIVSSGE